MKRKRQRAERAAGKSPYFVGRIGKTVRPQSFPARNYLFDAARYGYEGHWAFCRFDGEQVYGARFGFGRGMFDWTDYGSTAPLDPSNLWIHLELMTREGAALWIGTGKFKADQIESAGNRLDLRLRDRRHEIFRVRGWPRMTWHFESDDREAEATMAIDLRSITILPDCVMPNNRFAMWLATARARGTVRFQKRRIQVSGAAFYDHPRINIVRHDVPRFGWYLYTPMRFSDGSHLAGYWSRDANNDRVEGYCFGWYVDANGKAIWIPSSEFRGIQFDSDDQPSRWVSVWRAHGFTAELRAVVKPTAILNAWGGPGVAQTRQANGNMPLVFDCQGSIEVAGARRLVRGGGLAEYLRPAGGKRGACA